MHHQAWGKAFQGHYSSRSGSKACVFQPQDLNHKCAHHFWIVVHSRVKLQTVLCSTANTISLTGWDLALSHHSLFIPFHIRLSLICLSPLNTGFSFIPLPGFPFLLNLNILYFSLLSLLLFVIDMLKSSQH